MRRWSPPEFPTTPFPTRSAAHDSSNPIAVKTRSAAMPKGPNPPSPGDNAPHQDAGKLVDDVMGDLQSAGATIVEILDKPFELIGIEGPHRIIDKSLNLGLGVGRDIVTKVTR